MPPKKRSAKSSSSSCTDSNKKLKSSTILSSTNSTTNNNETVDLSKYKLVKCAPHHAPTQRCDIYVTRKSSFAAQLKRGLNLLTAVGETNASQICVYGLGAATLRAVELALKIKSSSLIPLQTTTTTGTTTIIDQYEPLEDNLKPLARTRNQSFVKIIIFKQKIDKAQP